MGDDEMCIEWLHYVREYAKLFLMKSFITLKLQESDGYFPQFTG